MWHEVKSLFHVIIVFQCIVFIIYLLGYKNIKNSSKWFLVSFLLAMAITSVGGILSHIIGLREVLIEQSPLTLYLSYPFRLAYIPFIFLYILSITRKNYRFHPKLLLHFIPFLVVIFYIPLKYYSLEPAVATQLVENRELLKGLDYTIFKVVEYAQFYIYAIASLIIITRYRKNLKASFSSIDKIYLSWPNIVIWGLICWRILRMTDHILYLTVEGIDIRILYLLYISGEIVFLVFITLLFLKGLKQPNVFFGILEETSKGKYEKAGISKDQRKAIKQKIMGYMEEEKPYLDPMINIKELAQRLSIPVHHLSQVINNEFDKNFFDFINSYRIEESKKLLLQYNTREKNILEILYECGYNSKSAFNTAFKKHTGLTPTQFRESASMKVA